MASRKEDERNERIIRNLLKITDNRRCINCNSLGPQYVCTNFWTFVCTACSGIHREFTHRVKSVSMAKFTSQEVTALQGGGNAQAKGIYFKELDPQRNSIPDSSNVERLRDFIRHVYVDRRYTGEKSFDKPPRAKMAETDDSLENRSGSRSPPYESSPQYSDRPSPGVRSDDRDFKNNYDERKSPGFDRTFPARNEIVNDWRREDRFGNGIKSDAGRSSDGSTKFDRRSPDRQRDFDMPSPPMVRPIKEILGDNVTPLRIIEPPKANGGRGTEGSLRTQRTTSSSSMASSNGNPTETKNDSLGSLIDFDAAPDPSTTEVVPKPRSTAGSSQSAVQPSTSPSADNWACFDPPAEKKEIKPPTLNTLDSLFSELSVQAPGSNVTIFPPVSTPAESSPFGFDAFGVVQTNNSVFSTGNAPPPANLVSTLPPNGMNPRAVFPNGGQRPTMPPQQYSGLPASGVQSTFQPFAQQVGGTSSNQPWTSSITPVGQGAPNIPSGQPFDAVARPGVEVTSGGLKHASFPEVKPTGRQALAEDLFASNYPYSIRTPAWQTGPQYGLTYNMPYISAMPMQSFPQASKSTNPFDFSNDLPPAQPPTFPSIASLQGALPNLAAPANISPTSPWMPSQPSHQSSMPPSAQSFAPQMPPSAYMGQQMPSNLFPGQEIGGQGAAFGPKNPNQQLGGSFFPHATTQNTFSTLGRNPFG